MNRMLALFAIVSMCTGVAIACLSKPFPEPAASGAAVSADDTALRKRILEIAKNYKSFALVDNGIAWAPVYCRAPNPPGAKFSKSDDSDTHGQKLYFLFAKELDPYLDSKEIDQPPGQVLVKQAWKPKPYQGDRPPNPLQNAENLRQTSNPDQWGAQYFRYAMKDDQWFHAEKPAGLFIMLKLIEQPASTDAGWIYATTNDDGTQVTAFGKLENCAACHRQAPRDRLFGVNMKGRFGSLPNRQQKPDQSK